MQLPPGLRQVVASLGPGARARLWVPAEPDRAFLQTRVPRWPLEGTAVLDVEIAGG